MEFRNGDKVHRLIRRRKWKSLLSLLQTKAGISLVSTHDNEHNLLSAVLFYDPPLNVIEQLLKICPLNSLLPNNYGLIPLHIACFRGASSDVVHKLILHDNGSGCRALDASGNCALHLLLENIMDPQYKNSTYSCRGPKAAITEDNSSANDMSTDSPHHAAMNCDGSVMSMTQEAFDDRVTSVEYLCEASSAVIHHVNKKGSTPIDILQDVKYECKRGPKYERADILYQRLKGISIRLYRDEKTLCEMRGYRYNHVGSGNSLPSAVSSHGSSISSIFDRTMTFSDRMDCSHFGK